MRKKKVKKEGILNKAMDILGGNPEYFGSNDDVATNAKDNQTYDDGYDDYTDDGYDSTYDSDYGPNLNFDSEKSDSTQPEPAQPDSEPQPEPTTAPAEPDSGMQPEPISAPAEPEPQPEPAQPDSEPQPESAPAQPEPEGASAPASTTEYDDDALAIDVHTVSDTINSIPSKKEDENKMQNLEYYSRIAAKIHDFHATGVADADVKALFIDGIKTDKELAKELLRTCLPELLDDPAFVGIVKDEIRQAADRRPDPVKRLFINTVDPRDNTEYETWEEACASVQGNPYVANPKDVFKTIYRLVDAEGNLGNKVSPEEIEKYAASFDGNREAFLARMGLKKKPTQNQQNRPQKDDSNKGKKPKKANNAGGNVG